MVSTFQRHYSHIQASIKLFKAMFNFLKNSSPYLKKIGIAGFLFFLIKGLIWLGVFAVAYLKLKD